MLKRIRWSVRHGSDVGVEVVQTTWAHVADVFEAHLAQDSLAIAREPKLLLPDAHINGVGRDPRWSIEGPGVAARGDSHCPRFSKHCDYEDRVLHGFPSVGLAHEVVARRVVRLHHRRVRCVTVETARSWPIPVDKLIGRDITVCRCCTGMEGRDERLGHVKPPAMGPIRASVSEAKESIGHRTNTHMSFVHLELPSSKCGDRRGPM